MCPFRGEHQRAFNSRKGTIIAVQLPNGVLLALGTALGSDITVSGISNANPGVATAPSHGLVAGDIIVITSGWSRLNERVVRVSAPATTFALEGIDTTSTSQYPAGSGGGTAKKVTTWTQITQALDVSTSGGEMQFVSYSFLENDFESQLPTQASAQSFQLSIADDPNLAGYQALKKAADTRVATPLRLTMPNGSVILYNGYVSFNETPSMTKNELMAVSATFSLVSRPVRYAA